MNLESSSSQETFAEDTESSGSTVILERSTPESRGSPEANDVDEEPETPDSRQNQARHYKVLQELYKSRPTLNKKDVAQLLDLEYQARRAYIDSDVMKEQDRPTKILQAYPCFRDLDHIMDELHRILNLGNPHFISELKNRWRIFFEKAQFYGVFKKVLKPPMGDKVNQTIALMKALPEMFPSPVTPPKKLGHSSEVMLHILEVRCLCIDMRDIYLIIVFIFGIVFLFLFQPAEYPNTFLHSRPLFSPVVIVCDTNCILAIGTMPVLIFPKEDIFDSVMYVMACYYTFHLTYPKCIATLISVLQIEVLMDAIHARDMTSSYKKATAEWKKFTE
ncbi:uncharacterized protein LOC112142308 isoform X1 [Oryzias melastigma]|uniref:uncharacterized protein LOC112142308 isoform X1 n=1 Tax=Oryzias melastigma TaxID=30732 RepID=UPI00168D5975|nr:uncharacterized protein LOC112142308 isoform X1 [Oryzias melastigma]